MLPLGFRLNDAAKTSLRPCKLSVNSSLSKFIPIQLGSLTDIAFYEMTLISQAPTTENGDKKS